MANESGSRGGGGSSGARKGGKSSSSRFSSRLERACSTCDNGLDVNNAATQKIDERVIARSKSESRSLYHATEKSSKTSLFALNKWKLILGLRALRDRVLPPKNKKKKKRNGNKIKVASPVFDDHVYSSTSQALDHSAARHRMAVRPANRKRQNQIGPTRRRRACGFPARSK